MEIWEGTYNKILLAFSPAPPETGGIIGCSNGIVSSFEPDIITPITDRAEYAPNINYLNTIIEEWVRSGISFCGIIHSHPIGQRTPSNGDILYIRSIMSCMPDGVESLLFPIIIPGDRLYSFKATRCGNDIRITPDPIRIMTEGE